MSDDMSDFFRNSPGLQNILRQQGQFAQQEQQMEQIRQNAVEAGEEIARQRDEERRRNQEHLEASQATAARLEDVNQGLIYVTDALREVNRRLDQQGIDSAIENKKSRRVNWLSVGVGAVAAAAAIGVPFIVLWIQSGG